MEETSLGYRLFFSYAREEEYNKDILTIKSDLEKRGHQVWIDVEGIVPGQPFDPRIEKEIRECDKMILFMTPKSVGQKRPGDPLSRDSFCMNEIALAGELRKPIIPVMVETVREGQPLSTRRFQLLDMTSCFPLEENQQTYQGCFKRLLEAIETTQESSKKSLNKKSPYSMLEIQQVSKTLAAHKQIVGRETYKEKIKEFIREKQGGILLIEGQPGIGKTALLANLVHQLKDLSDGSEVIHYFFGKDSDYSSIHQCIRSLRHALADKYNWHSLHRALDAEAEAAQLLSLLTNIHYLKEERKKQSSSTSKEAGAKKTCEIFVIDAIDESSDPLRMITILQKEFPPGVFFIISSRTGRHLDVFDKATDKSNHLEIKGKSPENLSDAQLFLTEYLQDWPRNVLEQIAFEASGNFLFLQLFVQLVKHQKIAPEAAVDYIKQFGTQKEDPLYAIYRKYWTYLREQSEKGRSNDSRRIDEMIGLLSVSFTSLTKKQFIEFLGKPWDVSTFERVLKYVKQFIEPGRPSINMGEPSESTYQLYHDSFRSFSRMLLKPDLPKLHRRIVNFYHESSMGGEPELVKIDSYGIKYLVKHASLSDKPHLALQFFTPSFVRKKTVMLHSISSIIEDNDAVISAAAKVGDLTASFRFALLEKILLSSNQDSMLGLEGYLRARAGDDELALTLVDFLNNPDDRLLARTELTAGIWHSDRELAMSYLRDIGIIALDASVEVIELAAAKILEFAPQYAVQLAKKIPEPKLLTDMHSSEVANSGRSLFRLFQKLIQKDLALAANIAENNLNQFDGALAAMACAVTIAPLDYNAALDLFKKAWAPINQNEIYTIAAKKIAAKYLIDVSGDMNREKFANILRVVETLVEFQPFDYFINRLLKEKIREDQRFWRDFMDEVEPGRLKDMVRWQLFLQGFLPHTKPEDYNSSSFGQMALAKNLAATVQPDPPAAAALSNELSNIYAYAYAVALIAEKLAEKDPERALLVLHFGHQANEFQVDLIGFYSRLELLRVALRIAADFSFGIFSGCVKSVGRIKDKPNKEEAKIALETVMAEALLHIPREHAPEYFKTLLKKEHFIEFRRTPAESFFKQLPPEFCEYILTNGEDFELIPPEQEQTAPVPLLFPETQIKLLILLIGKTLHLNPDLSKKRLRQALKSAGYIDKQTPGEFFEKRVLSTALEIGPAFLTQLAMEFSIPTETILEIVNDGLSACLAERDGKISSEQFLRWEWELILSRVVAGTSEAIPRSRWFELNEAAYKGQLAKKISRSGESGNIGWLKELPDLLAAAAAGIDDEIIYKNRVTQALAHILTLDHDLYFEFIKLPFFKSLLKDRSIPFQQLGRAFSNTRDAVCTLYSKKTGIAIIYRSGRDLNEVGIPSEYGYFLHSLAASAAAFSPVLCCEILSSIDSLDLDLFFRELKHYSPEEYRHKDQIQSVLNIIQSVVRERERLSVLQLKMLAWIGADKGDIKPFLEPILEQCENLSQASNIKDAAVMVCKINQTSGEKLLISALSKAVESGDVYCITDIIDLDKSLTKDRQREVLDVALNACLNTEKKYRLDKILKQLTPLDIHVVLRNLEYLKEDGSEFKNVISDIVRHLPIDEEEDVRAWITKIQAQNNLNQTQKNMFLNTLIESSFKSGKAGSEDLLDWIESPTDKAYALLNTIGEKGGISSSMMKRIHKISLATDSPYSRAKIFELLARHLKEVNPLLSFEYQVKFVEELAKENDSFTFNFNIPHAVGRCYQLEPRQAGILAEKIYDAVTQFPYDKDFHALKGSKIEGLFWAGVGFWASNKTRGIDLFRQLKDKYLLTLQNTGERAYSFGVGAIRELSHFLEKTGKQSQAPQIFKELVSVFPDYERMKISDIIVKEVIQNLYVGKTEPLERYRIVQRPISGTGREIINAVLNCCSPGQKARTLFAVGVSAIGLDSILAAKTLETAVSWAEKEESFGSDSYDKDIFIAYAATNGIKAVLYSIKMLSSLKETGDVFSMDDPSQLRTKFDAGLLLHCALEQMETLEKKRFLTQLWRQMKTLKSYFLKVGDL